MSSKETLSTLNQLPDLGTPSVGICHFLKYEKQAQKMILLYLMLKKTLHQSWNQCSVQNMNNIASVLKKQPVFCPKYEQHCISLEKATSVLSKIWTICWKKIGGLLQLLNFLNIFFSVLFGAANFDLTSSPFKDNKKI